MTELFEATFRAWILEGISTSDILNALYNVCAHGDIFEECGFTVKQKQLTQFFKGLDISLKAIGKIEQ